jgi:hypothetical protein
LWIPEEVVEDNKVVVLWPELAEAEVFPQKSQEFL